MKFTYPEWQCASGGWRVPPLGPRGSGGGCKELIIVYIEAVQQRWLSPPALRLFTREGKKEDGTRGRDKRPQSVARYYTWTAVQLVLKLRFNFQSKKKIKTRYGARAELFWQQLNFWVGSGSRLLK